MPETDPAITPRCTRCDSDAIIPDGHLYLADLGSTRVQVGVERKPTAKVMKSPVRTDIQVRVCGDCGLVEVETADPHALWDAYVDRLARDL